MSVWFATRPELFVSERSPRKTVFWLASAVAAGLVALLVYLNPTATVELLGGRVRSGQAVAGAFVLPPLAFVACIVLAFLIARRWRVRGGGVLQNSVILGVRHGYPLDDVVGALERGSTRRQPAVEALALAQHANGDDRLLTIWSSERDHVMVIAILRVDGNAVWIDSEPVMLAPDSYFDAEAYDREARRLRDH
ncbi:MULTISPECIES: hypothetical protein [unclassified Pseudoclavibacter]|uniref:hypothetical protein n=1 Tax=unclassified Pseudoclavibacter TaxID=2615177 RepID=UPI00201682EB|nr:hypothetical protein [Pseudoclavibacter sp. Marseille-Q4354]